MMISQSVTQAYSEKDFRVISTGVKPMTSWLRSLYTPKMGYNISLDNDDFSVSDSGILGKRFPSYFNRSQTLDLLVAIPIDT